MAISITPGTPGVTTTGGIIKGHRRPLFTHSQRTTTNSRRNQLWCSALWSSDRDGITVIDGYQSDTWWASKLLRQLRGPIFFLCYNIVMKKIAHNLEELVEIAKNFLENIEPTASRATIIGLHGDLGSGKTAFVKVSAVLLGVAENVTSPTFLIEKKYRLPQKAGGGYFKQLIHIDAYRLSSGSDLLKLDWQNIVSDPLNLIVVEWPEIVQDILPADYKRINFQFIDENMREIEIL